MRVIEKRGKTVEEAVSAALTELGLTREEVEIQVLEEAKSGFLGLIGSKEALVKVTEVLDEKKKVESFLQVIFEKMRLNPEYTITEENGSLQVRLVGKDLGIMIGRRGETLDSLQFLLNLYINKSSEGYKKVVIDIEDYRKKREDGSIWHLSAK